MHLVMGVPLRIATATSNLMIGITASASAIVYVVRGGIDAYRRRARPRSACSSARASARALGRRGSTCALLRLLFVAVLLFTAFEMARRAAGHRMTGRRPERRRRSLESTLGGSSGRAPYASIALVVVGLRPPDRRGASPLDAGPPLRPGRLVADLALPAGRRHSCGSASSASSRRRRARVTGALVGFWRRGRAAHGPRVACLILAVVAPASSPAW